MGTSAATQRLETLLHEARGSNCPPIIMGILNVTPDSFSDGHQHLEPQAAIAHADEMIRAGAGIIDVGPESTRPGSDPVSADEQVRRCVPVIRAIREAHPEVPISIDTRSAIVARAAFDAGADMLNDVSALRDDPELVGVVADRGAPVVLMHMKGQPKSMQKGGGPGYEDVVAEIIEFLERRIEFALANGVDGRRIVIDPGIGFGKTVQDNLEIIRRLSEFRMLERPILFGASRKSFIGAVTGNTEANRRLGGSLSSLAVATINGASILRVHDVAESVEASQVAWCIHNGGRGGGGGAPPLSEAEGWGTERRVGDEPEL